MTDVISLQDENRELFPGKSFDALLFDMDGTLLTSIGASERVWGKWAEGFGLNAKDFLPRCHGMRVADVVASLGLPGVDAEREAHLILMEELTDLAGVAAIAGARDFLMSLPKHRWAVITSAPRVLAVRRLSIAGLPTPDVLVTAEDVDVGKPDPAGFLIASRRLHCAPTRCVVFEDAPAGVQAGVAAGCEIVVVTAAHQEKLETSHQSIRDYRHMTVRRATSSG